MKKRNKASKLMASKLKSLALPPSERNLRPEKSLSLLLHLRKNLRSLLMNLRKIFLKKVVTNNKKKHLVKTVTKTSMGKMKMLKRSLLRMRMLMKEKKMEVRTMKSSMTKTEAKRKKNSDAYTNSIIYVIFFKTV